MVKYIISLVLGSRHVAKDSSKKLFSASIPQLQSMLLFTNMYGWLGILIRRSLLMVQILCLSFGQFARIISLPPSSTVGVISDLL